MNNSTIYLSGLNRVKTIIAMSLVVVYFNNNIVDVGLIYLATIVFVIIVANISLLLLLLF